MTTRQAACDPCRRAKLSCDHRKPICGRCEQGRKSARCVYRIAPFQRRRSHVVPSSATTNRLDHGTNHDPIDTITATTSPQHGPYPNAGHFGSLSHVAIFNQIPLSGRQARPLLSATSLGPITQPSPAASVHLDGTTEQVAELLRQLLNTFDLASMKSLVDFWCAKGVSLALAEHILSRCADSIDYLRSNLLSNDGDWHSNLTAHLIRSSMRPIEINENSTLDHFTDQFCGRHIRWETLGIFLAAVIRSTFDVPFFPNLYTTEARKQELRSLAARLNKCSLDLCLSLDCLNDLQLMFQYENLIVQSYVDGDHNLSYYRSLGDGIAFLFALGYHENIRCKPNVSKFMVELRRTAFARIFSADKNVAIFLGRPPRMSKRFCYFQIPLAQPSTEAVTRESNDQAMYQWSPNADINYAAETRWTAICASIKEDILELFLDSDRETQAQKATVISSQIEQQWLALPVRFRLHGNLNDILSQPRKPTPFELDFLANTRLNYLHSHFVLALSSLSRLTDPDSSLVKLARQILSLSVETILLRDHLVNSGISLIWKVRCYRGLVKPSINSANVCKVAHYGLPAAGVLLLAMLSRRKLSELPRSTQNRVWQDLGILSAEIRLGSIIRPGQPLYELLSKAAHTIQTILESGNFDGDLAPVSSAAEEQEDPAIDAWFGRWSLDSWNMEAEFWQNLAEHPYVIGMDPITEEGQESGLIATDLQNVENLDWS